MSVTARILASAGLLAALAPAALGAEGGAPPSWLKTEGKSEAWLKETAKVRELLAKLDPKDKAIARWIPAAEQRCRVIGRMGSIGFRQRLTYVDQTEVLLEDLVAGKAPYRRYAGKFIAFGYWSEHMQRVNTNLIVVPPDYDPAKEYQLFIYYKMGGDWIIDGKKKSVRPPWRPNLEMCLKAPGTFHSWSHHSSQLKGRMGSHVEVAEFPAALAREFSVSVDRVFMSGFSDGGFTPLFVGSRWPHLLAGIAPEVANWQYSNSGHVGLLNLPVLHVDGWNDAGFVDENFARFQTLSTMGADIEGLWAHHGHATKPYEDEEEFLKIMAWAKPKRRNLWPERVRYSTWSLRWHRAYWVSIERFADPRLAALVDVQVKPGNRIEIRSKNVARVKLDLSAKLVDMNRPVTVAAGGRELYSGPAKPEITVDIVKLPESRFYKEPASHGGITATVDASTYGTKNFLKVPAKPWTWVRGTGGEAEETAIMKALAPKWAKDDSALTEAEKKRSLFVFGGPLRNRLLEPFAKELPVRFEPGRFTIGGRTYDRPEHCVKFIFPNPHNPEASIIVYAFNDLAAAKKRRFFGLGKESSWRFREGDCRVYGVTPAESDGFGLRLGRRDVCDVHLFDSNWRSQPGETLGVAKEPFDYVSLLRLRADAIREATGADAAVVTGLQPGHAIWENRLRKGPVTLHDVAVTNMFPNYILRFRMTGRRLKELAGRAVVSTVLAEKSDPSYAAGKGLAMGEIDDAKSYTVATDYGSHGALVYYAKFKEMPKYFHFKTPEEFDKHPGAELRCHDLVQTEIETTEAVADYIRRHREVAPRPTCFSLVHYMANPRQNHLGAYDWAHVALAKSFEPAPADGASFARKVTLNVALKRKAEPAKAPPRENSKSFASLDLDGDGDGALTADFARLAKKLPVTAEVKTVLRGLIVKGADGAHSLAPAAGAGAGAGAQRPVGEVVVLRVTVANAGPDDLDGIFLLGSTKMRAGVYSEQGIWSGARKMAKRWYSGFADVVGPRRKENHVNCALLLFPGGTRGLEKVILPGAGYNRGVIAGRFPLALGAGGKTTVPMLFVSLVGPKGKKAKPADLAAVLEEIKAPLLEAAK